MPPTPNMPTLSLRGAGPSLGLPAQGHSQVRGHTLRHREQGLLSSLSLILCIEMGFPGPQTHCLAKLKAQTSHPKAPAVSHLSSSWLQPQQTTVPSLLPELPLPRASPQAEPTEDQADGSHAGPKLGKGGRQQRRGKKAPS